MHAPTVASSDPLFDLQNLDLRYGSVAALQAVSLQIFPGEKVALIGSSGAGKSTLLNKLYQLQAAQSAYIHQQFALVPQLSVFHNIYIGRLDRQPLLRNLQNLLRPQRARVAEIAPLLAHLGLQEKLHTRVGELSGGQQQRVAVGRALYRGGKILLADEPVSSLDVRQGEAIVKLIMETEKTVVASLHSVDLALNFARRVIGLRQGRILFDRPSEQVNQPLLDALYRPC